MFKVLQTFLFLAFHISVFCQSIYVSTTGSKHLMLADLKSCSSEILCNTEKILSDIAITPNKNLYGTEGYAVYSLNTSNCAMVPVTNTISPGGSINSLVAIDNDILFVATKSYLLYKVTLSTGTATFIDTLVKDSSLSALNPDRFAEPNGDLTWYNNKLYLSALDYGDSAYLVEITLNNDYSRITKINDIGEIDALHKSIYGMATVGTENCPEDSLRIIVMEQDNLYLINPQTGSAQLLCYGIFMGKAVTGAAALPDSYCPLSSTITSVNEHCLGQCNGTASISVSKGAPPYQYLWSDSQTTPSATDLCSGNYTVKVTDAENKSITSTVTVGFNYIPPESYAGTDATVKIGSSIQLNAEGEGEYYWSPSNGLSCITCKNPIVNPSQTTSYTLTVSDVYGCSSTDEVIVSVDCGDIFIPNIFSPNGDGQNDLECLFGNCIESVSFMIFDRWGQKVFETNDKSKCWDGTYNGKPLDDAVFVYRLTATIDGISITRNGNINLVR